MVALATFALPRVTSARPAGPAKSHQLPRQCPGWFTERPSAPEQRHDLSPRISSPRSLFAKNRLILKPSKLTLGAAAVTVAAVAGIAIGTTTGSSAGTGDAAALNQARVSKPAIKTPASPASPAPRHEGAATHRVAAHSAHVVHHPAAVAKPAAPAAPYLIYDSVIPSALPANHVAAVYATGPYSASPAQVPGKGPVVWIDTIGSDPNASALDVEPGDATPAVAATWARQRLSEHPHAVARIYTMLSEWGAVKAAVAALPQEMQTRIRWWIANPTGVAHLVPGSDATQWYWGAKYDISTATPRF